MPHSGITETLSDAESVRVVHEKDSSGMSIMDRIKECYRKSKNIEVFLDDAYEMIKGYENS